MSKVRKFLGTAVGAFKCVGDPVPRSVAQHRLNICGNCPNLRKKQKTCKLCGCYMPKKATCSKERTAQGIVEVRCPDTPARW